MRKEAIMHAVCLLSTAMPVTQALCQSPGHNYVMTETPLDEAGTNRVTAVEYMDGLGRPVETVTDGLGTDGSFAWSTRVYDIMGRVTSERLPGVSSGRPDNKTDTEALALSQQSNGGDQFPFTDVSYDYSGRETVSFGPGIRWRQTGKHASKSYSFTDKPVREVYELRHSGGTDSAVVSRTYSSVNDAPLHTDVSCDGGQPHRVSSLTYDGLGRVVSNTLPGTAGAVTYSYNVRGWPTAISHGLGSETLSYTDGPGTPLYSGDVSSVACTDGMVSRGYKFTYDALGRLSSAVYGEGEQLSDNTGRYSETGITYNRNGALTGLRRYGRLNTGGYGLVDDLTVTLDGDRVDEVSDAAVSLAWTGSTDFKEGDGGGYVYDGDGRLTYDPDKEASFTYDLLGHPCSTVLTGMELSYIYGPGGEKLEERVTLAAPPVTPFSLPLGGSVEMVPPPGRDMVLPGLDMSLVNTTRYCGPFVIRYGMLDKFLFDGGYYNFVSPGDFHYYLRDHLGSNRVVVSEGGVAEQVTHYYPLGGVMGDISTSAGLQPWKFSGKEEVSHGGLNLFDFGARLYDPALGVWTSTDPHAEDYYGVSHHAYCANNFVNAIDPDGRDWYQNNKTLYYTWFDGNADREGFTYIGGKGSLLGEFESKINNILISIFENKKGLYSEERTIDFTDSNKGAILPSDLKKMDDFLDEFVFGYDPEISILTSNHPYTKELQTDDVVIENQQKLRLGNTKIPGQITEVVKNWGIWDYLSTPSMAKQFVGSYSFDSYTSNDGKHLLNIVYDTKSFRSLVYHLPGSDYFNHSRNSGFKPLATTYQFYIWKSKK